MEYRVHTASVSTGVKYKMNSAHKYSKISVNINSDIFTFGKNKNASRRSSLRSILNIWVLSLLVMMKSMASFPRKINILANILHFVYQVGDFQFSWCHIWTLGKEPNFHQKTLRTSNTSYNCKILRDSAANCESPMHYQKEVVPHCKTCLCILRYMYPSVLIT